MLWVVLYYGGQSFCPPYSLRRRGLKMIEVTKLNGVKILVNPHLFEVVEETPDTVITLTTGKKIIVKESRQEIKNLVKSYRKGIFAE
jgi:flagellar protein FlbD